MKVPVPVYVCECFQIYLLFVGAPSKLIGKMMNAVQPKTPNAVMQARTRSTQKLKLSPLLDQELSSLQSFQEYRACLDDDVEQALQQHGAAVGGKKMMLWEFRHAKEAVSC